MIPYIHVSDLPIGPFKIGPLTIPSFALHPFGLLVATGVIIGTWLAVRRARARALDVDQLNSFITWMLVAGFLGGHMLDQIFYHPDKLLTDPLSFFKIWTGLSSFGGFIGGLIGVVLWKYFEAIPVMIKRGDKLVAVKTPLGTLAKYIRRAKPMPILPFCDLILSVFPVAWVFGRSGCSVVHDHPGMKATADTLLAVAYPADRIPTAATRILSFGPTLTLPSSHPNAAPVTQALIELHRGPSPRFDLGLLEMMFTVLIAVAFALTWRRKLTTGSYVAAVALAYAPVRFAMDFLRIRDESEADPRYFFLTPAQWACVGLFALGIAMVFRVRKIRQSGEDPLDVFKLVPRERAPDVPLEPEPAEKDPAA